MDTYHKAFLFKNAARNLIAQKGLVWIDKLSNPAVEKAWNYFHGEVLEEVAKQPEDSFIIEESSNQKVYAPSQSSPSSPRAQASPSPAQAAEGSFSDSSRD
jgi:hypothetical protein